jgi:hypothetical protein
LIPAKESGYLERFKEMANKRGVTNRFGSMAKEYQKSVKSGYQQLLQKEKIKLVDVSTKYYLEDYGVTFFIADQYKPVLFFADKQNKAAMEAFRQCNALRLNGDGGFAHLQLRGDVQFTQTKRNGAVVPINGNRVLLFNSDISIQGIAAELQSLNIIKEEIVRTHTTQLEPINKRINKLLEQLSNMTSGQQEQQHTNTVINK